MKAIPKRYIYSVLLMQPLWLTGIALAVTTFVLSSHAVRADGSTFTEMWGTSVARSGQTHSSSEIMHQTAGIIAGQVNSADEGLLYAGPTMTVVGSQSIVQVTGHNNVVSDINQDAVNSGSVELNSAIN